MVRSGSFTEEFNLTQLPTPPDEKTKLFFVDIEKQGGDQELVYLSADRKKVVVLDLTTSPGQVKVIKDVIEPIDTEKIYDFHFERSNSGSAIAIANNLLIYGEPGQEEMISGSVTVDGQWGEWSDWYQFNNGTTCSKICGNGIEVRNRSCNNPEPRNGGSFCPMQTVAQVCSQPSSAEAGAGCMNSTDQPEMGVGSVHTKICRRRDCQPEECKSSEVFVDGSCEADPLASSNDSPGGSSGGLNDSVGTPTGGQNSGDQNSSDCKSGEVFEPFLRRCFKSFPFSDIWLTHRYTNYLGDVRQVVVQTHRLSVNHPRTIAMSVQTIARQYCQFQGHFDVVSWKTASYIAGDTNVFILCNIAVNGLYRKCALGKLGGTRFEYRGINFNKGDRVQYLQSVVCRDEQ